MSKAKTLPHKLADGEYTVSGGNVFADLGLPDPEELFAKVGLTVKINAIIKRRRMSRAHAASTLGVGAPTIDALRNYRTSSFPLDRLLRFLIKLGHGVVIVIRPKPRSRKNARIFVTAA